jgi:pyruvate kinase
LHTSPNKTRLVCTIGPASEDPGVLRGMMEAGMDVARLNLSHGDPDYHRRLIERIREVARSLGHRVALMGDLPGPKMRIGEIPDGPHQLEPGETLTLTTRPLAGDRTRVSVSLADLPRVVRPGDTLYVNDGFIRLEVEAVGEEEVRCRVRVGGELSSRKGLNLPGIDLGMSAFTAEDACWVDFCADQGLDALSQSFVARADDMRALRAACDRRGYRPFLIAKIERAEALANLEDILDACDGLMVARGDLGVEIPIAEIAVTQKAIMEKANLRGRPVITATQMLESMVTQHRPTRAEATDVANAILDGTDCVMLSAESAVGRYPVEAVAMLARIAVATEPHNSSRRLQDSLRGLERRGGFRVVDLIALSVAHTLQRVDPAALVVPTLSGASARNIARFRPATRLTAFSPREATCQALQFSYGVRPVRVEEDRPDWGTFARRWLAGQGIDRGLAVLTQGPSERNPCGNHRMEVLELGPDASLLCPPED